MKAVRLLIESRLPEELRDPDRTYTAKEVGQLLSDLAVKYPDQYDEINRLLADTGRNASYWQGETIGLDDLRPVFDKQPVLDQMGLELAALNRDDPEYQAKRESIWHRYNDQLQQLTSEAGRAGNNSIAQAVLSGARGKDQQLKMMITAPGLYQDSRGRTIPMFASHSFSEGLRPAEFLAGTYGARTSVLSTKRATAKGGDLGKMMVQVSTPTVVTARDCGTDSGIDLDVSDPSMKGRILAHPVGDIPAGTVVDRSVLRQLEDQKQTRVVVRSALTCTADRGVCQHCVGKLYDQELPKIGQAVGITAAQSLCLAEGTLVRMADGQDKPIEQVQAGDMVLGSDLHGVLTPTRVVALHDNGVQECWRYDFCSRNAGTASITSTPNHRMLTHKKVKSEEGLPDPTVEEVNTLRKSQRHYAAIPMCTDDSGMYNVPEAALIGVLLGDGCITGGVSSGGITLSAYDPEMVKDLEPDLLMMGLKLQQMAEGEYRMSMMESSFNRYQTTYNGTRVRNTMKRILINLGLWGKWAKDKTLPECVNEWDNESVFKLLGGLLATDGYITDYAKHRKSLIAGFTSNSLRMLEQIRHLLQTRLGVPCGAISSSIKKKPDGGEYAPTYHLTITGYRSMSRLNQELGPFIPGVKRERLKAAVEGVLANMGSEGGARYPQLNYRGSECVGMKRVYDLEVDHPDHLFMLSNLIITHNSEPITQGGLSVKHLGGTSSGAKKQYSGFDVISQLVQSPEEFPDRAVVAEEEGTVSQIEEAPQGGYVVTVGETQHYVPHGYPLRVEQGQQVEAGDQLSEGLVDAGDIVRLRGLGSGRRYFANRLHQVLGDSGFANDRRNVELFARGAIDHIRVEDDEALPGTLPDDQISYNWAVGRYNPPTSTKRLRVADSVGKVLQAPALHYSIGTRLKPSQVKKLEESGYDQLYVADSEPGWQPEMQRLRTATQNNPDWLARMHTSYLKSNLQHAAVRGQDTDLKSNIHYAPRLAIGKDFGKDVANTGEF